MVYRISGEDRFLRRAEKEMLAAAPFPDWNPDHYLDTGEMTAALGIGLDWLYSDLSPETRETIADAIYEKGLRTLFLEDGSVRDVMFTNWTQVCYGGLSLGALAIAERDPRMAEEILNIAADRTTRLVEGWYSPEGAYVEGPGYWDYGTSFHVLLMDALQSSLGSDFNMGAVPGLKKSSLYRIAACGPTGQLFNYSDCDPDGSTHPIQFWFASHYKMRGVVHMEDIEALVGSYEPDSRDTRLAALILLWLDPATLGGSLPESMLGYHSGGLKPIGIFRSAWNDPEALFLGAVGGKGDIPHGHLDAGTWVLDWEGVRWAMELGRQDYHSLESRAINIWNTGNGSARWEAFRYGNFGHNTLTANNAFLDADGVAGFTDFTAESNDRSMTIDLTPCFPDTMERITRTFEINGNKNVVIRDEWSGKPALKTLTWRMFTRTKVSPKGSTVAFSAGGKQLTMEIIKPEGAVFTTRPATEMLGELDTPLPGVQAVEINLEAPGGLLEVRLRKPGSAMPSP